MTQHLITAAMALSAALLTTAASAHVTLQQREANVGSSYRATFMVPHGCGHSATTKLRIKIPEGVIGVKPMPKPGWQIEVVTGKYEKPYAMFHGSVTEGAKEVTFTGGRLPDEYYDEFVLSTFLTADLGSGKTLYFPVVQECESGVNRWIEIPEEGKTGADYKEPAPGLKLLPKN